MSKALDDLRKLMARIKEKAEDLNLEMGPVTVVPSPENGGRDSLTVTFMMSPEAVESAEQTEARRVDDEFAAMTGSLDFVDPMDEARKEFLDSWGNKEDNDDG